MDKENLAPPPEVGDKGRRPYDRADVRTNKEVPRCAQGYIQHVVTTLPGDKKIHAIGVYNPPHPEEEVARSCIRNYIAQEAAIVSRKGEHLIVGDDFNVAETPRAQDGAEQVMEGDGRPSGPGRDQLPARPHVWGAQNRRLAGVTGNSGDRRRTTPDQHQGTQTLQRSPGSGGSSATVENQHDHSRCGRGGETGPGHDVSIPDRVFVNCLK
ncbi:hypothetical protein CYMTET_6148 [Cymbomonas tetramitiformis]|uniref:Endonuclease/exonuclease/phosphatase domain-containing protein n=1 Tax=Cymbomonas tetramitiformis TaxID=36881 RepID=A0AAE0LID2_9CHLO|nr:hypothetical protein CYMTET_6148 [Cymbomonas tetramitiformis]